MCRVLPNGSRGVLQRRASHVTCAIALVCTCCAHQVVSSLAAPAADLPQGLGLAAGFVPTPLVVADGATPDARVLRFPAGHFKAGNQYVLRFTALVQGQPELANAVDVVVTVWPSPLVAEIAGGERSGVALVRWFGCAPALNVHSCVVGPRAHT